MLRVYAPELSLRDSRAEDGREAPVQRPQVLLHEGHQARLFAHQLAFEESRIIRVGHHEIEIAVDVAQKLLARRARAIQRGAGLFAKLPEKGGQREAVQLLLAREIVIEQSLIHARGPRDSADARAGQAA